MAKNKKTNQKTAIVVIVVLVISFFAIWFIVKNRQVSSTTNPVENDSEQAMIQAQKEAKTFKTVFLEGTIDSMEGDVLSITNGDNKIPLRFNEKVAIFSQENGKAEAVEKDVLKKNTKVRVEINQEDSSVVGVEVL